MHKLQTREQTSRRSSKCLNQIYFTPSETCCQRCSLSNCKIFLLQDMLDGSVEQNVEKANPEEFIHLFLNNSERLVEFLEHLVKCESKWSTLVYNTLVEHYLHVWSALESEVAKLQYEQKVVRLLQSSEASYDKDQILILCHQHNFRRGILFLYEERKL